MCHNFRERNYDNNMAEVAITMAGHALVSSERCANRRASSERVRLAAHPAVWCAVAAVRGRRGSWHETVARAVLQGLHTGVHLSKSQAVPSLGPSGTRFA